MAEQNFETSKELKALFAEQFSLWKRKHRLGMGDLAHRCGVSSTYLSQIARYGRIPGKPVLILLAFNFELKDRDFWFRAARISDTWPYDSNYSLCEDSVGSTGFISLAVDLDGFKESIREVVKAEMGPRTLRSLIDGRPLRIGLNQFQESLLKPGEKKGMKGFFDELIDMLSMMLHCEIEKVPVARWQAVDLLKRGEIDLYGPVASAIGVRGILFSDPFCQLGLSAVVRGRQSPHLEDLAAPSSLENLVQLDYRIAVLRDSRSYLFAKTRLRKSEEELILCDSTEEAEERLVVSNISRPAHLMLTDSLTALEMKRKFPDAVELAFHRRETLLKQSDNAIGVRPDWPDFVERLNQCINFLVRNGAIVESFEPYLDEAAREVVSFQLQ